MKKIIIVLLIAALLLVGCAPHVVDLESKTIYADPVKLCDVDNEIGYLLYYWSNAVVGDRDSLMASIQMTQEQFDKICMKDGGNK